MQSVMDVLCSWAALLPLDCLKLRFMQEALIGIALCAPLAAAAGVQVVNFRLAFFSDAIGHSAFAGVALGLLCALGPGIIAPLLALAVGLTVMFLKRRSTLSSDTVIGVLFSAVVALGLALASRNPDMGKDMQRFLFGDILTINAEEILILFILAAIFYLFEIFACNRLIAIGVNGFLARTHRVHVAFYEYVHVALLSLVVIFCVKAVGVLLVTALLIVPAATARNLASSMGQMFWLSVLTGLGSGVAGLLISAQDWAGTAAGATIVLCACLCFAGSLALNVIRRRRRV